MNPRPLAWALALGLFLVAAPLQAQELGDERAAPVRLSPGEEFELPLRDLVAHGKRLFSANWTVQEGQGRPLAKGTGADLVDPAQPLVFPRNMNRLSAPDANSCAGCHNMPVMGAAGDFVTNVFVLGQRFDFASFDHGEALPTKESMDETGAPVELQTLANSRQTIGMSGSGYIEMLARQMTADLQALRNGLEAGGTVALRTKGVSFGTLSRDDDGTWITAGVEGLPTPSLASAGPGDGQGPDLLIRPFHQAGAVISLRQFTNNAMNHHHGIQTSERFGAGVDDDGDGLADELATPDVTAVTLFQAGLPAPGRVIPKDPLAREAILRGEQTFVDIGCARCHVPCLPLEAEAEGFVFTEPNPYNPAGNLRLADDYQSAHGSFVMDLGDKQLPRPRLKAGKKSQVIEVFAFTDFKLHDITSGPTDPNVETLDMHAATGSPAFFAGNASFLSAKLWGVANQPPYYHHGQYTTMRQAIVAHAGEAAGVMEDWGALDASDRDDVIEFLKSLQVLPERARSSVVNEKGKSMKWPDFPWLCGQEVPALPMPVPPLQSGQASTSHPTGH